MRQCRFVTIFVVAFYFSNANAEPLTIAVASNFARPAHEIAARYAEVSGHAVRITSASTGMLYAQISNGAPFDVLLAADTERPQLLEESGLGVAGSRFNYAIGGLVLWSRDPAMAGGDCKAQLGNLDMKWLAIANPQTAPYGQAAMGFLQKAHLWETVKPNLVYGENIAQTLHFVASGNANLGLIAHSQAQDSRLPESTCYWPVPESMHEPIEQHAILLQRASENDVAKDFLGFLRGPIGHQIISDHGYAVPQ